MPYLKIVLNVGVVPPKENRHFNTELTIPKRSRLEQFVVREDLPPNKIRILLQPLLIDFPGILLPRLVQKSIPHYNISNDRSVEYDVN